LSSDTAGPKRRQRELSGATMFLRVRITNGAVCQFSFSEDGKTFLAAGDLFKAREGRWVGAKVGLFATAQAGETKRGYADFDWFRVE
jgi:beta-xylosidase-like protein